MNDETTYKIVEANCHAKVIKRIEKIIEKGNLTKKKENNNLQVSHIKQVISMVSLKFANLN